MSAEATILELEAARCKALTDANYAVLGEMISDDLVHIHANGSCDDKRGYLEGIAAKLEFLAVSRPDVTVRIFGEIAVATGPMIQTVRIKANGATVEMDARATIVWRNEGGSWRICSFQATSVAPH
ncbi:nuclear transport factor 2 family protein [Sphingobium sp.]|uniref:nuclear transport factor 2 family protein n=1 Tax=Sphingobium sp. TaxID=1912891 RepID=UPI0028BD744F|nr:nuclear transport factor 2 family protein [Sphingobium sp.]